jgi:hypothetical protein
VNNLVSVLKKQNVLLFHFLMLCRQRNKDYLCHWLMIEMLAYEATGMLPMAANFAVECCYATSTTHAFAILDKYSD